ncbi:MAG TPA: cytochrome c oxidase assembly protein [Anaerolineae bacterium]|nr:cytochrome c oxidase assembly protein [Anaerolineae bacterium]
MNVYYPPADFWWTAWTFDPSIWFGIVILHGAYLLIVGPLRMRFRASVPITSRQLTFWTLGILTLIVALITPLSTLSDQYLFSAHMLQHVLLTLVAPPLMLLGLPSWFFEPLRTRPALLQFARSLTNPFFAFAAFNVIFVSWHIPMFYNLALYSSFIHLLEHASMIFTALLLWMPILSPTKLLPRLPLPVQVLYIFLASIIGTGLGAILTLAPQPIYIFYTQAPRIWGISALDDQIWAGLIMWIGAGMILLLALTIVFFRWFGAKGPIEGEHEFI